ncbi:MAG: type II toxin-antitoxin system VapC family toxin [Candidatus Binataceae bacterium]
MPAIRHAFTDEPVPRVIVADSSFIFHALFDDRQGYHLPARRFAERLRKANSLFVYSSLVFLEAPQCWRRLYRRGLLSPSQGSIDATTNRLNAFAESDATLEEFLAGFNKRRANISRSLLRKASVMAARYDLQSHDALVVALARDIGVSDLAAIDRGFRVVDGLELWDGLLNH